MHKKFFILSAMSLAFLGYQHVLANEVDSQSENQAPANNESSSDNQSQPSTDAEVKSAPQNYVVIQENPPPEVDEIVPVQSPGNDYIWAKGYWKWDNKWRWYGGRWVKKPHQDAELVQGRWIKKDHGWYWSPHHWE